LLNRPAIQDELERKYIILMDLYKEDLKKVQSIFLYCKDKYEAMPYLIPGQHLPNVSKAIYWCRGLKDRIDCPMQFFNEVA